MKFNVFFKDDLLALTLACPDARDHISLMPDIGDRVTLKLLCMYLSPAIPFTSLSLSRVVTCLVKTVILSWSNSY